MIKSHIILAAGWVVLCTLHSVFAALGFKQIAKKWMGRQYKFYRLYYTIFAFISFAVVMIYLFEIHSYRLFAMNAYTIISGSIISLACRRTAAGA